MHTSVSASPNSRHMAGVLLHPTSLPGPYGIGELGDHVIEFLDWAASAGLRIWQVLPLNPPGYGASPYGCLSSFAGNPLLISVQRLLQDGLLEPADVAEVPRLSDDYVEFDRVAELKFALLRKAWQRFSRHGKEARHGLAEWIGAPEQREWLDDYTLYMAIKDQSGGSPWWLWEEKLARRDPEALEAARRKHVRRIHFWEFAQFVFFRQWTSVREAAHARNIRIMGDVPIYVASDSVDVWANRELFHLDERGLPTVVAGVPPDYFSETGQRWGNPLYRWDLMRESQFRWWVSRVRMNLRFADIVRLDHFRGFAAYWEIPASEPTAVHGRWMPGPGLALFEALRNQLGELPLIAEDLGFITDDVHELRRNAGLPGMKILQFGFGQADSPHMPHRLDPNTVIYTGTHDNDTARGWFEKASEQEREDARLYLGCTGPDDIAWSLIRTACTSVAGTAIFPLQDLLGLGSEARMNTPGEELHNWAWRVAPGALRNDLAAKLRRLCALTGR